MILRLLIGLATAETVAGAATAITVFTANTENEKSKGADQTSLLEQTKQRPENEEKREEEPRPKTIASEQQERQELHLESEPKIQFEGKLVFNRGNRASNQLDKKLNVIYKGELLRDDQYTEELKKWKKSDEEEDDEAHIKIDISSEKTQQELQKYLDKFNEKISKQPGSNHIEKLKTSLEENKRQFNENFGTEAYDEFLKAIKKNNLFD